MRLLIPEFSQQDERGAIVQVATGQYQQIVKIFTKQGKIRGGHWHKNNNETFLVITGRIELRIKKDGIERIYYLKAGDDFLVEEDDSHTLEALEDTYIVEIKKLPYDPTDTHS